MRQADRAQPPHKHEIARYWHGQEPGFVPDIAEPSCFACGWFSEKWPEAADGSEAALRKTWGATRGLAICHLIPHSVGGSSDAGNLVLLCGDCHDAAPDFLIPGYMLKWMRNREPWAGRELSGFLDAAKEAFSAFGLQWPPEGPQADKMSAAFLDPGFLQFLRGSIAVVPAKSLADRASTYVAALCEYVSAQREPDGLFGISDSGLYV